MIIDYRYDRLQQQSIFLKARNKKYREIVYISRYRNTKF